MALNPKDAESLYWIGGYLASRSATSTAAQTAYARAAQIQPLIRRRAVKSPADFRVLALYAPFAGNTPAEYLFDDAAYDTDTLALLATSRIDAAALGSIDVVVNLISDADQAAAELPIAAALAAELGKPVVNDPGKIAAHHARRGRGAVAGHRGLSRPENPASRCGRRRLGRGAAGDAAVPVPAAGAAGRHAWRRRFREV